MEAMEIVQLLGNLGEFLGALAVFATLLYLAIQVREAGKSARLAAVEANRAQRIAGFVSARDSPYIVPIMVKLDSGQALSAEEARRLTLHDSAAWALLYSEWVQRELGLMGEFATLDGLSMSLVLSSPSAMDWWRGFGAGIYPDRFVEYVNEAAATREAGAVGLPSDEAAHALGS